MKLPLTTIPSSTVKLPVLKKEVRVRAMNIKEEKNLLIAKDVGDVNDVLFSINELVKECTYGELNFDTLTIPDVAALFIKIIELSKGATTTHSYICRNTITVDGKEHECGQHINVEVDLRKVKYSGGNESNLIELPNNIIIELMYPTPEIYKAVIEDSTKTVMKNNALVKEINETEMMLRIYAYCIKSVFQGENTFSEYTREEIYNWLLDMCENVLEKFKNFFNDTPEATLTYDIVCPKCGYKETVTIRGLEDFFTQDIPRILS